MPPETTPAAASLGLAARRDGWTPEREADFLQHLAVHGLVADAAKSVGMGLSGAYAYRHRENGFLFDMGWQAAMLLARHRLADDLMTRALQGDEHITRRDDNETCRRSKNHRLALSLLDKHVPEKAELSVRIVSRAFDPFLDLIRSGSPHAGVRAYFAARIKNQQSLRSLLASLPLSDESAKNTPTDTQDDGFEIREIKGVWYCDYPPPPGFDGTERGQFGQRDYRRTLSPEELAAVLARQDEEAATEQIALEQRAARAAALRDLAFGFAPEGTTPILVTTAKAGENGANAPKQDLMCTAFAPAFAGVTGSTTVNL